MTFISPFCRLCIESCVVLLCVCIYRSVDVAEGWVGEFLASYVHPHARTRIDRPEVVVWLRFSPNPPHLYGFISSAAPAAHGLPRYTKMLRTLLCSTFVTWCSRFQLQYCVRVVYRSVPFCLGAGYGAPCHFALLRCGAFDKQSNVFFKHSLLEAG